MSWNSKVIWSEGMFLQPQHLQQHDRYLQTQLETRAAGLRPYSWGLTALEIDEQLLKLGKLALLSCAGVMPDGTPFNLPADDDLPEPLDIPEGTRNTLVALALPVRRPGIAETGNEASGENFARHRVTELEVGDSNDPNAAPALMQIGKLRVRLALEPDVANAYAVLGIARVVERLPDNRVVLENDYSPPCLDYRVGRRLAAFVDDLVGLLHQRGEALAARLAQPGVTGVAEVSDFLLLQIINRHEPLAAHLSTMTGLHPEALFQISVQLAGELATFSQTTKRPPVYPVYRHDRLRETFAPVIDDLRASLSMVMDPHAVPIPLEERKFGLRVALVPDKNLFASATFVLAVRAQMPAEHILTGFAPQVKIGPIERIRDLVNLQLPGIGLRALPVAPRQLPFHAGFTYFELDRGNDLWKQFATSAGMALHVAGDFPGLAMEFWAIRR
ncbi:type VI secretion system baseplate subunit TssK [Burkholderia sp. Ac-20365]|jgi:type VI secretion system protein ImpJ|uniref:type VI secretion system baseplate subunit TssK n=1 Tax=Burkholderia sp. Ac-20365 TaxID=2703897 RepID=UPI00197B7449|nr:type VI secretion system baseplate subunit TssK [Burkholderia sp. Ac-20365]MBN3761816.1 type VI secretion system baseplate subunit TssK [Burkholderia sp. Ac-20365]